MTRIVIINLGAFGHVNPTLALTAELVQRGHDVNYFSTIDFAQTIAATGAVFHPYDSFFGGNAPKVGDIPALVSSFPIRLLKEATHVLPQILHKVRALRPEVILYDQMCVAGRLCAAALKIPAVLLYPTYITKPGSPRLGFRPRQLPPAVQGEFHDLATALTCEYHTEAPTIGDLFSHAEDLNLIFMPRAFHPEGDSFDQRYQFVGPGFARSVTQTRSPSTHTPTRRRLFISMGTIFNAWPEFFRTCVTAFGDTSWEVHMAVGPRIDSAEVINTIPRNFTVASYLPQRDILPDTHVAIYHGGMGTTMDALFYGVPLVAIAQMPEQQVTADRITELNLGRQLARNALSVAGLRELVEEVATDRLIKEQLTVMQQHIQQTGGPMQAVALLESFFAAPS